ncbi:ferredoxin [Bacillus toyonensis]|uniref:ferredoxin n=1 Tax=Bacillus toyonensis TaxID=155322 RepID=UPI002E23A5CD|nr:ferredoxin [Bacillus toyonensis]
MYTKVDKYTCIGCQICYSELPEIFASDPKGTAYVKLDDNKGTALIPIGWIELVKQEVNRCPVEAIKKDPDKPFS